MKPFLAFIMSFVLLCEHGAEATSHAERKLPNKIKGPKSYHDEIAIVGAGASGIHMAYLLKQKGFKNVHILEKSSRIGGKVYTKHHRNNALNMGAVEIDKKAYVHVMELIKKFLPNELVDIPGRTVWYDNKQMTETEFSINYIRKELDKKYRSMDDKTILDEYAKAAYRYNELFDEIFDKYEGNILPKPKNMELMKGTFYEFLVRNNLTILYPSDLLAFGSTGYSYLEFFGAFYKLIWGHINPMPFDQSIDKFSTLKCGYQKLWEVIVEKENLDVAFEIDIQKVSREYKNDPSKVWLYMARGKKQADWEQFDFLMWTPEMAVSMDRWMDNIPEERELLGRTIPTHYTVSIVDSIGEQHGLFPIGVMGNNLKISADGKVHTYVDNFAALRSYTGPKYQASQYLMGEDNKKITTYLTYQQSIPMRSTSTLNQLLTSHFRRMSASSVNIVYSKTWRFFPRHSVEDLNNGVIWKIIDMQGKYGMWYLGASVYFETVHKVTSYNVFMVQNMEMPVHTVAVD